MSHNPSETTNEPRAEFVGRGTESPPAAEGSEPTQEEQRENVLVWLPTVGNYTRQGVYVTCYYLSYGLVFGSLLIGSLLPRNNVVGEAVHDGVEAAMKAFRQRTEGASSSYEMPEAPAESGQVTA